jgi:hypothetical protein
LLFERHADVINQKRRNYQSHSSLVWRGVCSIFIQR